MTKYFSKSNHNYKSMLSKGLFLLILLAVSAFLLNCKKNSTTQNITQNPVPSVPVTLNIYPNDPLSFRLQAVGGWMYFDGYGVNGIIVYRKSEQEFVAIERTSTYAPNDPASKVKVQTDNFTLRDTVSRSEWRMFDGSVTKGPATWPLRLYGTTYDGNVVKVRN